MKKRENKSKTMKLLGIALATILLSGCGNANSKVNQVMQEQMAEEDATTTEAATEISTEITTEAKTESTTEVATEATTESTIEYNTESMIDNEAESTEESMDTNPQSKDGIDVDLTQMSSTMVYSEVYNMMWAPEEYIGKTVKMKGPFTYYKNTENGNLYFACIINDATACCSQGLEFDLEGDFSYPADYPALGEEITVSGVFETYEEYGYTYCTLRHAKMY